MLLEFPSKTPAAIWPEKVLVFLFLFSFLKSEKGNEPESKGLNPMRLE